MSIYPPIIIAWLVATIVIVRWFSFQKRPRPQFPKIEKAPVISEVRQICEDRGVYAPDVPPHKAAWFAKQLRAEPAPSNHVIAHQKAQDRFEFCPWGKSGGVK